MSKREPKGATPDAIEARQLERKLERLFDEFQLQLSCRHITEVDIELARELGDAIDKAEEFGCEVNEYSYRYNDFRNACYGYEKAEDLFREIAAAPVGTHAGEKPTEKRVREAAYALRNLGHPKDSRFFVAFAAVATTRELLARVRSCVVKMRRSLGTEDSVGEFDRRLFEADLEEVRERGVAPEGDFGALLLDVRVHEVCVRRLEESEADARRWPRLTRVTTAEKFFAWEERLEEARLLGIDVSKRRERLEQTLREAESYDPGLTHEMSERRLVRAAIERNQRAEQRAAQAPEQVALGNDQAPAKSVPKSEPAASLSSHRHAVARPVVSPADALLAGCHSLVGKHARLVLTALPLSGPGSVTAYTLFLGVLKSIRSNLGNLEGSGVEICRRMHYAGILDRVPSDKSRLIAMRDILRDTTPAVIRLTTKRWQVRIDELRNPSEAFLAEIQTANRRLEVGAG